MDPDTPHNKKEWAGGTVSPHLFNFLFFQHHPLKMWLIDLIRFTLIISTGMKLSLSLS